MLPPAILLLWGGAGFLSRGGIASKLHPALFVSLSFLAGSGITGICGLVFIAVGCRILNPAITTILLLTGVFGLRDWIVRIKNWSCPRFSAWPIVLSVLLCIAAMKPIAETQILPLLGWDSRIIWGYKAKVLLEEGTIRVPAFEDPYRVHLQPAYPVLVPILQAYFAGFGPAGDDRLFKPPIALFGIAALVLMFGFLRQRGMTTGVSLFGATLLAYLPTWASALDVSLVEIVSASFNVAAAGLFARWIDRDDTFSAGFIFFFASLSSLSKPEGSLILFLLACMMIASRRGTRPTLRGFISFGYSIPFLVSLVGLSCWFLLKRHLPFDSSMDYDGLLIARQFELGLPRIIGICGEMAKLILMPTYWGLLFPLFLIAAFRAKKGRGWLSFLVFSFLCLIIPAFILSSWQPVQAHIRIAFPRIVLQIAPIAVIVVSEWCGGLLDRGDRERRMAPEDNPTAP